MSERDLLAAEYALGVLEAEALVEARGLLAADPAFAVAVAQWQDRLAPMLDEIGHQAPPAQVWERVRAAIADAAPAETNVVALKRRLGFWRGASAAATAVAASLLLLVAFDATRAPVTLGAPEGPAMAAVLVGSDRQMVMSASWRRGGDELMVMAGAGPAPPGHSHEVWVIPADGRPRSLGLVSSGDAKMMPVAAPMRPHLSEAATLAVSLEPAGGSPTGLPTGPVIASGKLHKV